VSALLDVRSLSVDYEARRAGGRVRVVDDVSFELERGGSLGLVGESGSGKSTLVRAVLGLVPCSGSVRIAGRELVGARGARLAAARAPAQLVAQDPSGSLDPRVKVGSSVIEPLVARGARPRELGPRVAELLSQVGLSPSHAERYPHELSGGQRQRVAIARALAPEPSLLVLDEPVSALDVSVGAQLIALLDELRRARGLTLLFVSHDLALVRALTADVMVLEAGRVVERGPTEEVLRAPAHARTRSLVLARRALELLGPSPERAPPDGR
jgi:peptide/nickel transport system ATP-binding protein